MSTSLRGRAAAIILAIVVGAVSAAAQGPGHCPMHQGAGHGGGAKGCGGGPRHHAGGTASMSDDHAADMEVFRFLLDQGDKVRRTVTKRADGVETLTESDDPAVADKIRVHVASMYDRVKDGRPIHQRDPLFRAVFAHAGQIVFKSEPTDKGVRVVETSTDPKVAALIQAHAEVVSKFIANGHSEAMTDHEVPAAAQR
jgi:hypothetical protein